jgi:hypothetical protein
VGCSRKPKEFVNGYDIIIAMQKWQLERGYFLHQSDGNNCGLIACVKSWNSYVVMQMKLRVE